MALSAHPVLSALAAPPQRHRLWPSSPSELSSGTGSTSNPHLSPQPEPRGLFVVMRPTLTGPFAVTFTRWGGKFKTLEAAKRSAQRLQGRVLPYGGNRVLLDFSDEIDLTTVARDPVVAPTPVSAPATRRQTSLQALHAWGLQ